jgi:hypothetical protein
MKILEKWSNPTTAPRPMIESGPRPTTYYPERSYVEVPDTSATPPGPKIPWHLAVLVLDNIDYEEKVHRPLVEVDRFLRANSRFGLKWTPYFFNDPHQYTLYWDGTQYRYDLHWSALPSKWLRMIEPCSAVLALYSVFNHPPEHAGSTWGLPYGININGKLRPWAAVPAAGREVWYYNNQPYEGFPRRDSQIISHEVNNTIQGVLENMRAPCGYPLVGTPGDPAWKYESDRLACIQPACYAEIGQNED